MAEPRPLRNAPVAEAVIDIHVAFAAPPALSAYERLQKVISDQYPHRKDLLEFTLQIAIAALQKGVKDPDKNVLDQSAKAKAGGFSYTSADGKYVLQCRPHGMTFSRLSPYENYDAMVGEATRIWRIYRELFAPLNVTRIATRFINRLELPGPVVDFDDYFTVTPRIPAGLPDALFNFNTVISIPAGDNTVVILRTNYDGVPKGDKLTVMLDLDIMREVSIPASDEKEILGTIAALTPIKNRVFFGSLTDKALELFS